MRRIPVDGGRLWFDPATGLSARESGDETTGLRLAAPRLVQFAPTARCDLSCAFCDQPAGEHEWTVPDAFDLLAGLAEAGALEVALGGGEPLLFDGLPELLQRLATKTRLAVHCTTNGVALEQGALLEVLEHCLGELRLSLHPDNDWRSRIDLLVRARLTFGVNLLLTPATLPALEATLLELLDRGCEDVLLLRYVGPDRALGLDVHEARDLERRVPALHQLLAGAMRLKLSVCWGDLLGEVPRTHVGLPIDGAADCGAGRDQVVITADRRMKPCSFHPFSVPIRSAADVLDAWRGWHGPARGPAGLPGCGRSG
jgi:MoaA/NifB/PqqE/SkfB family radical SAM enzyme